MRQSWAGRQQRADRFAGGRRRGAQVAYVKTKDGYEVDFLGRGADGGHALVQVCAEVDDPDTLAREVRGLQAAAAEHPADRLLLLTGASRLPFPAVPDPIEVLPAWQWMLEPGAS